MILLKKTRKKTTRLKKKAELQYARQDIDNSNSRYREWLKTDSLYQIKEDLQNPPAMKDVRTIFTSQLYGDPQSYQQFANRDKENEVYQAIVNKRFREERTDIFSYQNEYFLEDGFTFKNRMKDRIE